MWGRRGISRGGDRPFGSPDRRERKIGIINHSNNGKDSFPLHMTRESSRALYERSLAKATDEIKSMSPDFRGSFQERGRGSGHICENVAAYI